MSAIGFTPKETALWGDTWECKKCGYENYEGIGKCPICGTKKGKSS